MFSFAVSSQHLLLLWNLELELNICRIFMYVEEWESTCLKRAWEKLSEQDEQHSLVLILNGPKLITLIIYWEIPILQILRTTQLKLFLKIYHTHTHSEDLNCILWGILILTSSINSLQVMFSLSLSQWMKLKTPTLKHLYVSASDSIVFSCSRDMQQPVPTWRSPVEKQRAVYSNTTTTSFHERGAVIKRLAVVWDSLNIKVDHHL